MPVSGYFANDGTTNAAHPSTDPACPISQAHPASIQPVAVGPNAPCEHRPYRSEPHFRNIENSIDLRHQQPQREQAEKRRQAERCEIGKPPPPHDVPGPLQRFRLRGRFSNARDTERTAETDRRVVADPKRDAVVGLGMHSHGRNPHAVVRIVAKLRDLTRAVAVIACEAGAGIVLLALRIDAGSDHALCDRLVAQPNPLGLGHHPVECRESEAIVG